MTCISRIPACASPVPTGINLEPITKIFSTLGTIFGGLMAIVGALAYAEKVVVVVGVLGGPLTASVLSALLGGLAVVTLVAIYQADRCVIGEGLKECVAGVVNTVVESFGDALDVIFPFTAMHDRVEIVTRSRFWDVLESTGAFVHCTADATGKRSEIMRCYFFSAEVCAAAAGATVGASIGMVAGVFGGAFLGAFIAAACATIVLCVLGILVAFLVGALSALTGAFVGGLIGRLTSQNSHPSDSGGNVLATGDLVSIDGQRARREYDSGAWVMWMSRTVTNHGRATSTISSTPFTYCDIDEQLTNDSCPLPPTP